MHLLYDNKPAINSHQDGLSTMQQGYAPLHLYVYTGKIVEEKTACKIRKKITKDCSSCTNGLTLNESFQLEGRHGINHRYWV
jgi:hypothetical protein